MVPQPDNLIRTCLLGGGITAEIIDVTSHYFGGYYHVVIRVSADIPVVRNAFESDGDYQDALRRLGETVRFTRDLEKMAVPEGEIDAVRSHLLDAFDTNVLTYLSRPDFACNFVRSQYRTALQKSSPGYR